MMMKIIIIIILTIIMNKSQETAFFSGHQKLTSTMKAKARKVLADFKFDAHIF